MAGSFLNPMFFYAVRHQNNSGLAPLGAPRNDGLPARLRQAHDKLGNRRDRCRLRSAAVPGFAHRLDQRRADHDAVGALRDRARLLGIAHAETDADRELGCRLMRATASVTLLGSGAADPVMPVIET